MELALVLPLVAMLLLLVVQVGLVVRDQLLVTNAAREAARALAADATADVTAIVGQRSGLENPSVVTSMSGDTVRVDVHTNTIIRVPLLALLRPTVGLHASATMRMEHD